MQPEKRSGFLQELYSISATALEDVGTLRRDKFGNKYRYAKAGATALEPGKNTTAPATNADWENIAVAAAVAIGGKIITATNVAVGADVLAEDYFKGGQLQVNDAAGEGHWYRIAHSSALTATSTTVTITIEDGVKVALTTSSEVTLVPSNWMATIESDASSILPAAGVPLVDVTANYYYWSQTGGDGVYWTNADVGAVGTELVLSTDAGELSPNILAYSGTADTDVTQAPVAIVIGTTTHIDTEYNSCRYIID
jgi:hypothetical protein